MSIAWYNGFDDSGQKPFWDQFHNWLAANAPKAGKYYKQIMKDPTNSSLATASRASIAHAQRLVDQNYTVDPEIATHAPEVLASQLNKRKQDVASEGSTSFMNALAGLQSSLYGQNLQRRLANYQTQADARARELEERSRLVQGVQRRSPFMAALGVAAPFLGLIPGVGPALAAGAGAASSMG